MSLRRTDCLLTKKFSFFSGFRRSVRVLHFPFVFIGFYFYPYHVIPLSFIIILLLYPLLRFRVFLSHDTKSPSYGPGCLWLAVCPVLPTYPSPCFIICFTPRCHGTFHNSDSPNVFTVSTLPAQTMPQPLTTLYYLLLFYRLNVSQKCIFMYMYSKMYEELERNLCFIAKGL